MSIRGQRYMKARIPQNASVLFIIMLFYCFNIFAEELPTLMEYLKPQFKCDVSHSMNKKIDSSVGDLDTTVISVLDTFKFSELSVQNKINYNVSYKVKAVIKCNKKIKQIDTDVADRNFIAYITTSFSTDKNSKKIELSVNIPETKKIDEYAAEDTKSYIHFSSESKESRPCLVKVENLIKDISLINVDRLCEGRTEKEKKYTELQIKKMVSRWKNERGIK